MRMARDPSARKNVPAAAMQKIEIRSMDGIEARIYDTFSEADFEAFRSAYAVLLEGAREQIATSPRFFRALCEGNRAVLGPFVLVIYSGGQPEAMAIGRREVREIDLRIGLTALFRPRRRCLVVPEGGVLVKGGSASAALRLWKALLECLARRIFDAVAFLWLPLGSGFYRGALRKAPWLLREYHPLVDKHWYTELPGSLDELLARKSAKHRGNCRRAMRKIESSEVPRFRLRVFRKESEVDDLARDADAVAARSYQRTWGGGFADEVHIRGLLREAARAGELLAFALYADDRPCAFQIGIDHDGSHNIVYMAHDPDLGDYSPGTYLLLKCLEELCSSRVSREVDYGWGDGSHKERFGTRYSMEACPTFFAPTLDGLALSLALSAARMATKCCRRAAQALGLYGGWKRSRKRMRARSR
jgi:hypothetical protein